MENIPESQTDFNLRIEPYDEKNTEIRHFKNTHQRDGIICPSDPDIKKGMMKLISNVGKQVI